MKLISKIKQNIFSLLTEIYVAVIVVILLTPLLGGSALEIHTIPRVIITFIGLVIFKGKAVFIEVQKRFHM